MTQQTPDHCPIAPVGEVVFNRWTTQVLWVLTHHGRLRFNELAALVGGVTPKMLTQRLRQLERDGLVERTYFPEIPPRVEYEITELGRSLSPVFASLVAWSDANLDKVEAARTVYDAGTASLATLLLARSGRLAISLRDRRRPSTLIARWIQGILRITESAGELSC